MSSSLLKANFVVCFSEHSQHTWSDVVVLVTFFTLCACISLTIVAILCWLRPRSCFVSKRGSRLTSHKRHRPNMSKLSSFSSQRPLSCGSFYSSSYGSGSQDTEESSEPLPVMKNTARPPKTVVSPLARHSVYSDSVAPTFGFATLQVSQRNTPDERFASLGNNFRSNRKKRELGRVRRWMMENSITDDEILAPAGAVDDEHTSGDVIAAHTLLQLPCGDSKPHYSATKFHSFRAKKSRRAPRVTSLDHYTPMNAHQLQQTSLLLETSQGHHHHPDALLFETDQSAAIEADSFC